MNTPFLVRRPGKRDDCARTHRKARRTHHLHLPSTGLTLDQIEDDRPRVIGLLLILLLIAVGIGAGVVEGIAVWNEKFDAPASLQKEHGGELPKGFHVEWDLGESLIPF